MDTIQFFAENNKKAKQIAINDFVNKASKVLECYKDILETWAEYHVPHTAFYSYFDSMFTGNDEGSGFKPIYKETISDTKDALYERVKSFIKSKDLMYRMMGGGEWPFIILKQITENKYEYYISR